MAVVDDVRSITSDKPQYDRALATGDGTTIEYELPNAPVLAGTAKVYLNGTLQTLTTNYTIDEALGLVTFVAAPANGASIAITYKHTILSDADITTYSTLTGDTRYAAAMALDTIASSEALIQKAISIMGISTNGPATAAALRAHAKSLREAVTVEVTTTDAGFDIAEQVYEPFGWRDRVYREALRDA